MPTSLFRRLAFFLTLLSPLAFLACSGIWTKPPGPYLGATPPGDIPVLFAPDTLKQLTPTAINFDFSPDGRVVLVTVPTEVQGVTKIQVSYFLKGAWTPLKDSPFIQGFTYSNEPVFSPDDKSLHFTGTKADGNQDLWTVSYAWGVFGTPTALPSPISSPSKEWRGSVAPDGSFYFGSQRLYPEAYQLNQIYKATKDTNGQWSVEWVPAPINGESYEGDPCVAPDGRWILFYSCRNWKTADLYVSFRESHGGWGDPIRLGPEFNASEQQYAPHLSRDGKYLFFTRESVADGKQTFWVSTSAIDKLKPVTPPYFNQPLPGEIPVAFAPQQLKALGNWVSDAAFSPDWTQCFASVTTPDLTGSKLHHATFQNGAWTPFADAPFTSDFTFSGDPVFSMDGASLAFTGTKANGTKDLWTVPFTNQIWGAPTEMPPPINNPALESRLCVASDGTVYFSSDRSGVNMIYSAKKDATGIWVVTPLPATINSGLGEADPTLPPTRHCIVFSSNRDGQADLYVSFRKTSGWGTPVKLGAAFNTDGAEFGAHYSPNGHYLFFTRHTPEGNQILWATAMAVDRLFQ